VAVKKARQRKSGRKKNMQKEAENNKKLQMIRWAMLIINVAATLFVTIFVYITTELIRGNYNARNFLDGVNAIPWNPLQNIITVSFLLVLIIISCMLRLLNIPFTTKMVYISLIVEFLSAFAIVVVLNFNYNGIFFLFFADMISYSKGNKGRFFLIFGAIICFMLTGFEIVSLYWKLYSVRTYIAYYSSAGQQYLLGFFNVLSSASIALFIIYCIFFIQEQRGTIDEVSMLNGELGKANEDLKNAKRQLEDYAKVTEHLGETRERNRLAREIHDTLGHTMTGLSAGLDACLVTVKNSPDVTQKQLELLSKVAKQGIQDIRYSVNELKPDALERLSLENAILEMITEMKAVSGMEIFFQNQVGQLKFDEDEEMTIYRVVQESLTNSVRHGKAKRIWVTMTKEKPDIILKIHDDGIGCTDLQKGFGTKHIIERIEMLNGTVKFDGTEGFTVVATIPIRWGENYD